MVFWNFDGFALRVETPTSEPNTCFIRLRPTSPEELFPSPRGCLSLPERSNKADEFTAPQETTTISPRKTRVSPLTCATTPVTSRPDALVCNRNTFASVISVMFGSFKAGRTALTSASDFAPTRHGYPSHVSHRRQGLRCIIASLIRTPIGAG